MELLNTATPMAAQPANPAGVRRTPLLGIGATAVATLLAIELVPQDVASQYALFSSALLLTAGLIVAPLAAALRSPHAILRAEHVIVMAPIYWLLLDLLQGSYPLADIPADGIRMAFLAIGSFVAAVWLGASGSGWRLPYRLGATGSQGFSANGYFLLCVGAFALAMLTFAIPSHFNLVKMFTYLGEQRWGAPWARGQLGGWDAFADQLQYFGYLLPALTVIVGKRSGWQSPRTLSCIAMTLLVTLFLAQSGSRRVIGIIFGVALIVWILTDQRLRSKHVLLAAVTAALLLVSFQVMLEYRNRGLGVLATRSEYDPILEGEMVRVDDNFYRLCQVMELIPQYYPHTYHRYLVWVLVRPIPRVFWPSKPIDPGFDLPAAIGKTGVSLSMSVIGELYMAAGFIGIFLGGWFYGRIGAMANRLLRRNVTHGSVLLYAILTMSLFTGVRSMLDLVLTNYALLAWLGLAHLMVYLQRPR